MRLSRVFLVGVDILSAFQADGVYIIDIRYCLIIPILPIIIYISLKSYVNIVVVASVVGLLSIVIRR